MKGLLLFVLLIVTLAAARSKQELRARPLDWELIGDAPRTHRLSVSLALKHQPGQRENFFSELNRRADPSNKEYYGKWFTGAQVRAMLDPGTADEVAQHVRKECRLLDKRLQVRPDADAVDVRANVACLEHLFGIKLGQWRHLTTDRLVTRAARELEPRRLHSAVELVIGLVEMPPRRISSPRLDASDDELNLSMPQIKINASMPADIAVKNGVRGGPLEYSPGDPSIYDLQLFCQEEQLPFTNYSHIQGNYQNGTDEAGEATLDVQMFQGIAPGIGLFYGQYSYSDGSIYNSCRQLLSLDDSVRPHVVSISYGFNSGPHSEERNDLEAAKLTATGTTIVTATGDNGQSCCNAPDACTNDQYPTSSPYMINVGASSIIGDFPSHSDLPICQDPQYPCGSGGSRQVVMANNTPIHWGSAAGFSGYATAHPFQKAAIDAWQQRCSNLPDQGTYNASRVAYPDLMAPGTRVLGIFNTQIQPWAGTSVSSPLLAAQVALMVDKRLGLGKAPLGWMNPLIYQMPASSFNDITIGQSNPGQYCRSGINACEGFDPASGFGSINFANMLSYVENL